MDRFDMQWSMASIPGSALRGFVQLVTVIALLTFFSTTAHSQDQRPTEAAPSDLARQNMDRVSASASQIEAILRKDSGLMVELKAWVAKDATDHGQLISDSDLTDQAIYDRLETDVQFRSIATRLLQKFGYLLPKTNPDSEQGKEQELLIEERTKWLAQDQEEARTEARQQAGRNMLEARSCDPQQDPNCTVQRNLYPAGQQQGAPTTGAQPGNLPLNPPAEPGSPQHVLPTLEQTQLMQTGAEAPLGSQELPQIQESSYAALASLSSGIAGPGTLVPSSRPTGMSRQGAQNLPSSQSVLQGQLVAPGTNGADAALYPGGASSVNAVSPYEANGLTGSENAAPGAYGEELFSSSQPNSRRMAEVASQSQRMVRQPNPYIDVPSLYDMYLQAAPQPPTPDRFGMQVFENGTRDSQLIPFDLPAGPDYVVGPGDSLAIDLWGGVSQRLLRTVDREGRLSLPEVGPVLVAGKSMADVQESVQKTLRTQFRDVSADVSLSRLRTIRVYVVGDVAHPGAYDISSLSTPLNALFAAGGPTSQGSLRELKHNRGDQTVQDVDVYDLLLRGVKSDIERLENGDTVLVPPMGPEVTVEGMVRRPAIYELRDEKSLSDVLTLAGGLLPTATLRHIEVQRVVAHEKKTMLSLDIPLDADSASVSTQLNTFQIQDGDKIRIFPIAPYNQDTLYLEGHVLRPGRYSYHSGMRVTDLISSYKDLLPEPATQYAEIIRLNTPDYRPTVESFNLADALSHPGSAPLLEPLDTVQIFGRFDFENPPTVSVLGDVRVPGTYRTSGQIHLSDAIHMAGGLAPDAETEDAQVFHYLPNGELTISSVKLSGAIAGNPADNIVLDSRDRILIHSNPADVDPATVYIKGEVSRPGRYPLTTNLTAADLIRAAGGFKRSADTATADLTRYVVHNQEQLVGEHEEINLDATLSGGSHQNIPLVDGDILAIRQIPGWNDIGASVVLKGEVEHPGTYGIRPGERLSSVLERAGGFLPTAFPAGAVLVRVKVRELQEQSRARLIDEIQEDSANIKPDINASAQERSELQQASIQQHQQEIQSLEQAPVTGRVVVRIPSDLRHFRDSPEDVELREGDSISIPKRPDFVIVTGQVYNTNAITYVPGRDASWYLNQAGGATNLANKKAIFIIRADGGVVSGHGEGWWMGNVLSTRIAPGDTIVVPEKPVGGSATWKNLLSVAQIAQAGAMSAFVFTR